MTVEITFRGDAGSVRQEMADLLGAPPPFVMSPLTEERIKAAITDGPGAITVVSADEPEKPKTRAQRATKKTTVADLPADVVYQIVGGVSETDPDQDETVVETQAEVEKEPERVEKAPTENDIRNLIIDFLNEMQAAHPDDPDIRTKTLKPLLDELGAQKISLIPAARYGDVPALLDAARKGSAK